MKVYTQASFDILHKGHINLLKKCRKLAGEGEVIVSLISDESYEEYRGYKPSLSYENREAVVSSIHYVDRVIKGYHKYTQTELIKEKPDIIVLGSDWVEKDPFKHYRITPEWLEEQNILLIFTPYTHGVSSTKIKEEISEK